VATFIGNPTLGFTTISFNGTLRLIGNRHAPGTVTLTNLGSGSKVVLGESGGSLANIIDLSPVGGTGSIMSVSNSTNVLKASGFQCNAVQAQKTTATYGTAVTPNAANGSWQGVTVTNGTAFTMNAPSNAPDSGHTEDVAIEITNSSGGTMGTITWNAAYVFAGASWANPANTKRRFARFTWNGGSWICTGIASADY
jgi:hypothetical protein